MGCPVSPALLNIRLGERGVFWFEFCAQTIDVLFLEITEKRVIHSRVNSAFSKFTRGGTSIVCFAKLYLLLLQPFGHKHRDTLFNLFCIFSVSVAGFYVPFTYLPKAAIEKGITRENAAFLLSIIGTITPI